MGFPAARLGDPTVHGGTIVVGLPTVLIGDMPASRIGDMHVCPMVTVLVPHVGGPLVLGSFTVLVGGPPQSRVTDMLVCVGPPDMVANGCDTVLVGMAGGGMGLSAVLSGLMAGLMNFLSGPPGPLGDKAVAEAVKKSPTLSAELKTLQEGGWKIQYGPKGKGTATNRATKIITVDSAEAGNTAELLTSLAHESGHAMRGDPVPVPIGDLSRDDYVKSNVHQCLLDEGDATVNNIKVKQELAANGGPDITVAGVHGAQYEQMYNDSGGDSSVAREKIADAFGDETASGTTKSYNDYYGEGYGKFYDEQKGGD